MHILYACTHVYNYVHSDIATYLLSISSHCIKFLFHLAIVPIPNVTVTALSNLTINSSLLLKCSVTTFEGINISVDIEWKSNGELINSTKFKITENAESVFNDSYIDHYLTTEDNGTIYQCNAIINTPTPVNATDDYTVGKY